MDGTVQAQTYLQAQTNGQRYWDSIHESCQWGATDDGGMNRLTLNDDDKQVRLWFIAEAEALGCKVTVDSMGNIFAVRPGKNNDIPPIGMGSHLDTQPRGGRYDGIAGVIAGLEVIRALHEANHTTYAPIAVIDWTNEEGARFPKAMVSSGVWAGKIPQDQAYDLRDVNEPDTKFVTELERIGFKGTTPASYKDLPLSAHFELHIEQGPILEAEEKDVGIVTGIQGMRWYDAEVIGREAHTGTTPMNRRCDALVAAAAMIQAIEETAVSLGGLGTVGIVNSLPQSTNTIPGEVNFSIDLRHTDESKVDELEKAVFDKLEEIAKKRDVTFSHSMKWTSPALHFDPECQKALELSAKHEKMSYRRLQSGAGHDSGYTSYVCPTAMLFIPCRDGISHNPAEYSTQEQCSKGASVLLGGILRYDDMLAEKNGQ